MAVLAAALALQSVATTTRCLADDVRRCETDAVRGLVTVRGGPGGPDSNGRGSGFGTPSSALSLTFLKHHVPAWADLDGAELRHPPAEVDGIPVFMPSAQLASGSEIVFNCPRGAADVCDAWVFFYSCPARSCVADFQGGVPTQLAADGWQHTVCAPRFVTGVASGHSHEMRSYRTKVQPGESARFTTAVRAEFLAFGLDMGGVTCSKFADQPSCAAAPNAACMWSDNECVATNCRRGGKGPPPPCTECPWQGIERRDPKFGPLL